MSEPLFLDVEQGSAEWKEARCGVVTASRCGDVIATLKSGAEAAARATYRFEIMTERLTGVPVEQYVTREMQWGIDHEADARLAYELACGVMVETCGFAMHGSIADFGASPDGLVVGAGVVQFKCPTTKTHIEWMLAGVVPLEHQPQLLAELSVTGRGWCDFVSFDPRLPEHLQLFIRRFHRDETLIAALEAEVIHFNEETDAVIALLPKPPAGEVISFDQDIGTQVVQ